MSVSLPKINTLTVGSVQNPSISRIHLCVTATQMSHPEEERRGGEGVTGADANESLGNSNYKHTYLAQLLTYKHTNTICTQQCRTMRTHKGSTQQDAETHTGIYAHTLGFHFRYWLICGNLIRTDARTQGRREEGRFLTISLTLQPGKLLLLFSSPFSFICRLNNLQTTFILSHTS